MDGRNDIIKLRKLGFLLIAISCFISFALATTGDQSHQELGALTNYAWPPVIGFLTLIVFLFFTWITYNRLLIKILLSLLCLYNVYVGLALHFEKDYWPLVTF